MLRRVLPWSLLVLVILVHGGCASSNQQVIRPAYQERLRGQTTLGVLPLGADLLPPGVPVQRTPLTRQGHDLFYRLFSLGLSDLANVAVLESGPDFQPEREQFAYRRLALAPGDSVNVPVPLSGPVRIEDRNPAFLLIIDDLVFAYGTEEGREALGTLVTERLIMTAACEYVLWDNQAQQPAGYGRIRETAPTQAGANLRGPMNLLFQRLAVDILKKSPFVMKADA